MHVFPLSETITEHVEGRPSQLPDAQRLFSDRFFAIDHLESMLYLVALHDSDPSGARNWIESTGDRLKSLGRGLSAERCYQVARRRVSGFKTVP
jgi:hypothetical protein